MNEQEKKQALKITHLWKELHDKGTYFECREHENRSHVLGVFIGNAVGTWRRTAETPDMSSDLSLWRVADKLVGQKIIDLTKMVGSDVDMEFGNITRENAAVIGKLTDIEECSDHVKYSRNHKQTGWYHHCRIRQNHIHYYDGKGNSLPDGLLVKLYFNNNNKSAGGTLTLKQGMDFNTCPSSEHQLRAEISFKSQDIDWDSFHNVSGYEVIDTLPEYCYEWQK